MCVILLAYRTDRRYEIAVAANRDEYHERAAEPLGFWRDAPRVLAGRDLIGGGTWIGVTREGRFAAITNYREPHAPPRTNAPSRGSLTRDFLQGHSDAPGYLDKIAPRAAEFAGFSLIVFDGDSLAFFSNRGSAPATLAPGVYGLSNHLLDTPWPKVMRGRERLAETLANGDDPVPAMFEILADRSFAGYTELPRTGLELEQERLLSPLFITGDHYGTRSSTVMLIGKTEIEAAERTFSCDASPSGRRVFKLDRDAVA
ncbi:MAG: NRDE family protein [Acidobacteria bacterium]|nr:NRDE family protein [Acidobacteriota bacterium]